MRFRAKARFFRVAVGRRRADERRRSAGRGIVVEIVVDGGSHESKGAKAK
jgi:hypothetical protein